MSSLRRSFAIAALVLPAAQVQAAEGEAAAETATEELPTAHFEMTVIGTRSEQPFDEATAAAEVIDRKEIETSGARDVADVLGMRANVAVTATQFGSSVQLQGLDPDHVLVLVDGQRLAGRKGGVIDLGRIPLDSVARVEIVRGPASALYGSDAMGGVINIVTRRAGEPFEAEGELRYGERNTLDLNGSAATRGSAGLLRVTAGLRRGDAYRLDTGSVATSGSAYDETHALVRGETDLSSRLKLDGTASWSLRDTTGVDAGAGGAIYDRVGRLETLSASLRPQLDLGGGSKLRLTVEGTWLTDQFMQDQRGAADLDKIDEAGEQLWSVGLQSDIRLGSHLLIAGVETLLERMESDRLEPREGTRNRLGIYLQDEWLVTDDLRIAPGVRVDLQEDAAAQPAPRMAVRYDPVKTVILRGSYGMAWRAPSFQEMLQLFENPSVGYVVQGNPDLKPETSHGGTLGAEWKPTRSFSLGVEAFRQEIDDLISTATVREPTAGAPRLFGYVNVDRALTQGVETKVRVRPMHTLDLQVGYAFTDARDRDSGELLEGRARHRASGSAIWRSFDSGTEGSVRLAWVGERPMLDTTAGSGVVWADAFVDLSVHVEQKLSDEFSLLGGGRNLLDAGSAEFLPLTPRTIYGGVAFRY